MLEKHPVLKRALANQYQVILVAAAATLAVATISPLPFLMLLGGEFMVMPFMFERLKRRLEIEKKYAARQSESLSQNERYDQLSPDQKLRYASPPRARGSSPSTPTSSRPSSRRVCAGSGWFASTTP